MIIVSNEYEFNGSVVNRLELNDEYYCIYDTDNVLQISYEPVSGKVMSKNSIIGFDEIEEMLEWVSWMGLSMDISMDLL